MTMDDMIIVVVGDRAAIESDLEGPGYEIVLLGGTERRSMPGRDAPASTGIRS